MYFYRSTVKIKDRERNDGTSNYYPRHITDICYAFEPLFTATVSVKILGTKERGKCNEE